MSRSTLPTLTQVDVATHKSSKSCYVTLGTKVFDVTDFLEDHPGGSDLILEYGGKDVTKIMNDEVSHFHTEAAYEILDDCLIGFLPTDPVIDTAVDSDHPEQVLPLPASANGNHELREHGVNGDLKQRPVYESTGMSGEEDLSKDTDFNSDYKTHKFLDLNRPLFMQIWNGGFSKEFYLDQVHRPRHYRGGASAPLFGNFLEPLSKTPWWVVPVVWLPLVFWGIYTANQGLSSPLVLAGYWIFGFGFWTIIEYTLHRFIFHMDKYMPDNRAGITAHFILHGIHHYLPMDRYRLVMPPTLAAALAVPFWKFAHCVVFWNWYAAVAAYSGGFFGYICYDLTHYFLHHRNLPLWYPELKKYHLAHHFANFDGGFGVTSRFWDRIFGTELEYVKPVKST